MAEWRPWIQLPECVNNDETRKTEQFLSRVLVVPAIPAFGNDEWRVLAELRCIFSGTGHQGIRQGSCKAELGGTNFSWSRCSSVLEWIQEFG